MKKHLLKFLLALFLFAGWQSSFGQGVFISQNCDPQTNYNPDRFAEIYNPTASAVDLTGWTLENVQGGVVQFTWTLSGTIASGEALICGNADATLQTITPDFTATWVGNSWNGKGGDGTILKNDIGTVIDNAVQADVTGTFENKEMVRNANITGPTDTYDANEWTFTAVANAVDATPGEHICILPLVPIISNIEIDPAVVQATDLVTVSANVDANTTTVNSVEINWGTTSGVLGNTISMTNSGGDTWTTDSDIPAQILGTTVYYEIEVTYSTTETKRSSEQSYTVVAVTDVATIAVLRASTADDGTVYKLTGESVLTFQNSYHNQKYIEDATAAILIEDASAKITTSYNVGDGITGIYGTLTVNSSSLMLQFIPMADPGAATAGFAITPQEITLTQLNTIANYEAELVKLVDVNFDGANGTGTFAGYTNYTLGDGTTTSVFRLAYNNLDYVDNIIPHESIGVTLVGVVNQFNGTAQFSSRDAADMTIPDYIVITSPVDNTTFDTETDITVDFVTYNQTDLLTLEVWVESELAWMPVETDIDPTLGTITTQIPADAPEASTYKLRLFDQTDNLPVSNEVPFGIHDVSGPVFNYFDPVDGAVDVFRDQDLIIDFNEDIKAGTGNIVLKKYADDAVVATYDVNDTEIDITGMRLTINPATDLPNNTRLYVEIAAGVLLDINDNADFSVVKDDWDFTTVDNVAPQYTFNPADAANDFAKDAPLTISFDEAIYTMAGGATPFDNTTIDGMITFKLTDATGDDVAFDATINGTNDVITITPDENLIPEQIYYYAISNLFKDAVGNQGSAGNATFTTFISSDATLSALSVDNGTLVPVFASGTFAYTVDLPFGTTATPVTTATETDANANAVVVDATDVTSATVADRTTTVTVTAEDASTQDYTIVFNVSANDAKALTSFSFIAPAVTGIINEGDHTVAIEVPFGTDVTALIANFATSGAEVKVGSTTQLSGTTPNNFTNPITYTVVAEDASTQDYTVTVSITTGINNPDGIVSMNIYPNPSHGNFTLEMNSSKAGNFKVEIINVQGQVVFTKEIAQDGFYKETIDMSNQANGIYYVRINDGKEAKVSKIMIQ